VRTDRIVLPSPPVHQHLCLPADRAAPAADAIAARADYAMDLLESQAGQGRAREVAPGSLRQPLDLCSFLRPSDAR